MVTMPFDQMNEADVREEFLAPLLRELGYQTGSDAGVTRELALSYPRFFLGRKKETDPYLRGRADYVLEVRGHARWVLEAKSPNSEISRDDIDQAHSYALHPQVNAAYFAISNGRTLLLFRTTAPPGSGPLYQATYAEIQDNKTTLFHFISADSIRREFHNPLQAGVPLGEGLGSLAKIASGVINYSQSSVPSRAATQMTISVVDGAIERGEGGRLIAYVETSAPAKDLQALITKLGLNRIAYVSDAEMLSSNGAAPTRFFYRGETSFPAGEEMLDINTWETVVLPWQIDCAVTSVVEVNLSGNLVAGSIRNEMIFQINGVTTTENALGSISVRLI